jgi:uncharacterized protein YjcR
MNWDEIRKEYETTDITLHGLAEKHGIKYPTIKSRNQRQGWQKDASMDASMDASTKPSRDASSKKKGPPFGSQNAKGHGAPRGNKNAQGNRGGHGPPLGSKNALKTGEYETIWFDTLTEEEKALYGKIDTSTLAQVEQGIIFLTFRERRMMERIKKLMDGLTEKEQKIVSELREEKQAIEVHDEKTAQTKTVMVSVPKLVVTSITETQTPAIDKILQIEDGLTRVQQQKARFIALKQELEIAGQAEEEQRLKIEKLKVDLEKSRGGEQLDAVNAHNANISTLASLLNSPVDNRTIEHFEDDADA